MATSALAVVTIRPGIGATPSTGRKRSGSTPTGTTWTRSSGTWWSATMSLREDSETVITRRIRLATWVCIRVNEYQRRLPNSSQRVRACSISSRRSTVIGWWIVERTGSRSCSCIRSSPQPRHWLSCTRSKSSGRFRRWSQARRLNAIGSEKLPVLNDIASATSQTLLNSQIRALRIGKWSL